MGRTVVLYTGARVLAFAVCYAVLFAVGLRGLPAILAALLLSSLLSLFALRRQREGLTGALESRANRKRDERARLRGMLDSEDGPQREA